MPEFLKDVHTRLAEAIPCPLILHICGNTSDRIGMIAETGLDCFHWDTKTGHARLCPQPGRRPARPDGRHQQPEIAARHSGRNPRRCASGHAAGIDIVGPECAIPLLTPLENLKAVARGPATGTISRG